MSLGTDVGRFAIVPLWLVDALGDDHTALRLFIVLAGKYADRDTDECFPKRTTLAADLTVSEPTVTRAAKVLMGVGALTVEQRGRSTGKGGRTSNVYRLHFGHPTYRKPGTPLEVTPLTSSPPDTSLSEPEPPNETVAPKAQPVALPSQGGLWGQEERDRLRVMQDLIAESFNNRRGARKDRERLARLVRAGASVQQLRAAIAIAKEQTRDDPLAYSIGTLARLVEEGNDGSDIQTPGRGSGRAVRGGTPGAGARGFGGDTRGDGDRRGAAAPAAGGTQRYGDLW